MPADQPPSPDEFMKAFTAALQTFGTELRATRDETQSAATESRALAGEVRAERATVDAYRAELQAWRAETKTRFDSIDDAIQNLYQVFINHTHPDGNGDHA